MGLAPPFSGQAFLILTQPSEVITTKGYFTDEEIDPERGSEPGQQGRRRAHRARPDSGLGSSAQTCQFSLSLSFSLCLWAQAWEALSPVSSAAGPNTGSILVGIFVERKYGLESSIPSRGTAERRPGQANAKASTLTFNFAKSS